MIEPLISVILPVYNGEEYLSEAIESIVSQTFTDFEFIIIDDGSTDSSLSIAREYQAKDHRVVLICQENIGLVATLNKGISLAKGKYIARMDADDISHVNRFYEQVNLLEKGFDLCGSHFHFINESGKICNSRVVSIDPNFQSVILTKSPPFAHGSVMIRKSFLVENDLSYSRDRFSSAEDYYMWTQCFDYGAKIINVDKYLFSYREYNSSLSQVNHKSNFNDAQAISKEFVKNNFLQIEIDIKRRLSSNIGLNTFEQEKLAAFVFHTLFKRRFLETKTYLQSISIEIKIISVYRIFKKLFR